jgi:DNA polymerase-1
VQASAADWAAVLLAGLRTRLVALGTGALVPHLVFFQHDEVVVHSPAALAADVVTAIESAARAATALVFGATEVSFPMTVAVVDCYSDAK